MTADPRTPAGRAELRARIGRKRHGYFMPIDSGELWDLLDALDEAAAPWSDSPLPEDDAIAAAHPLQTGRHDLYNEAMRLVGARRRAAKRRRCQYCGSVMALMKERR